MKKVWRVLKDILDIVQIAIIIILIGVFLISLVTHNHEDIMEKGMMLILITVINIWVYTPSSKQITYIVTYDINGNGPGIWYQTTITVKRYSGEGGKILQAIADIHNENYPDKTIVPLAIGIRNMTEI